MIVTFSEFFFLLSYKVGMAEEDMLIFLYSKISYLLSLSSEIERDQFSPSIFYFLNLIVYETSQHLKF